MIQIRVDTNSFVPSQEWDLFRFLNYVHILPVSFNKNSCIIVLKSLLPGEDLGVGSLPLLP